jgi:hypothetical protein
MGNFSEYHDVKQVLKAGLLYFAFVFAAGSFLGAIRILCVVPRIGTRMAELIETPVMLVVITIAARWIVRRLSVPCRLHIRLGMGGIATVLLLVVEFTLVLRLRGLSIHEYFLTLDPVTGTVYYLSLGIFTIMPVRVCRKEHLSCNY